MSNAPESTDPTGPTGPADPVGPPNALVVPRYAGPDTFARLPRLSDVPSADVAILGVPFDTGVSYRPGARFGPGHIRESSRLLRPYNPAAGVSPFAALQVADAGDLGVNPFDIIEAITAIEHGARDLLERAPRLLTLGGDHTIALPLLRAETTPEGSGGDPLRTAARLRHPGRPFDLRRDRAAGVNRCRA